MDELPGLYVLYLVYAFPCIESSGVERRDPGRRDPREDRAAKSKTQEHAGCRLVRRTGNSVHVQRHLATIALFAARRDLTIGLVVDDRPAAAFFECEVHDAFHEGAAG